jgi:hypothetical protein
MDVAETLRALEGSLLTYAVRKDRARLEKLLAAEFREFGRSGTVYTRDEIVSFLAAEAEIRVTMKEFSCEVIGKAVALVTYRSERTESKGETIDALRSSLWVWREGRWQMVFHQGTPMPASAATRVKV